MAFKNQPIKINNTLQYFSIRKYREIFYLEQFVILQLKEIQENRNSHLNNHNVKDITEFSKRGKKENMKSARGEPQH